MECIFCEFVKGRKKHKNNYPLIFIHKTKETCSFLSIPDNKKETHLLIIPKKHISFFEDLPPKILNDLAYHLLLSCKVIKEEYPAYNILLNNRKEAEQYINHVHFHIIPKKKNKEPAWVNLTKEQFEELSKNLREKFKKLSTKQ